MSAVMFAPAVRGRTALLSAVAMMALSLAGPLAAAELRVSAVVLSSAGVAQFTHSGAVKPGDRIDIPVRLDQVDDLLKSLTVFDEQGAVGPVSLPGQTPLPELFRDLPFGPEALSSRAALLNALVGSEVEVDGPVKAKGRILRVESEEVALPNGGGTAQQNRLSLMTERGLVQVVIEDVASIRFVDPQTREQIERALLGYAENRAKDRRRISIGFLGRDERQVAVSYVVAAPVWKTSYRMVLPAKPGPARIQGWAILENLTGGDWKDVDLTLVSGNPVALKQQLYTAQFRDRPNIPVAAGLSVVPKVDDAEIYRLRSREAARLSAIEEERRAEARRLERQREDRLQEQRRSERLREGSPKAKAAPRPAAPPPPSMAHAESAPAAEEAVSQIIYRFPAKVSLATGHTMMLPYEDRALPAEQIALYQPGTDARHPLLAVRLKNQGDSDMPAGLITTFRTGADGNVSFVGDAQLPLLAKGAAKFVTFAVDGKTDIRREDGGVRDVWTATASDGVLRRMLRQRRTISYEITPSDEDRTVVLEEQRSDGWSPAGDAAGIEQTQSELRKTVAAPKARTTKVSLVLEHVQRQDVVLTQLPFESIAGYFANLQNDSPAFKSAVAGLSEAIAQANQADDDLGQLARRKRDLFSDEERIRQNLRVAGQNTEQGRTYLKQLSEVDGQLAAIAKEEEGRRNASAEAKRNARDLLKRMTF